MTTNDVRIRIYDKAFASTVSMGTRFFDFLYNISKNVITRIYSVSSLLEATGILSSSANDTFDCTATEGVWGTGELLQIGSQSQVPFENVFGTIYTVGVKFGEIPNSSDVNAFTGNVEYTSYAEAVGELGLPDTVVDAGGGVIHIDIDGLCEAGVLYTGRTARIYMVVPQTAAAGWYEDCTVQYGDPGGAFGGSRNYISTVAGLGQSTVSLVTSDYECLLYGLSVFRQGYKDLSDRVTYSEYIYLGYIGGNGPAATPTVFDTTGIVTYSPFAFDLYNIRQFIGKDTTGVEMPIYAGTNVYISDGDSLETAVGLVDAGPRDFGITINDGAIATPSVRFNSTPGAGFFYDSTGTPGVGVGYTYDGISQTLRIDGVSISLAWGSQARPGYNFLGSESTGMYCSAVNTLSFATIGLERIRVHQTGQVGIGTAVANTYAAEADNLVVADAGNSGITVASGIANTGNLFFADGTSGADQYRGYIKYNHSTNSMLFATDAIVRLTIDPSGNALLTNSLTAGGVVRTSDGISGVPSYSFTSDTNTGMYRPSANVVAFSTSGVERMTLSSSGVWITVSGSAATPSIKINDTNSGMYKRAEDEIGFSTAGVERCYITNNGLYGAVYNDVADYLELDDELVYGKCYYFTETGAKICDDYCQKAVVGLASDTAGFHVGYEEGATEVPISTSGWVLAHVDEVENCSPGDVLTSNVTGNLIRMFLQDKTNYPERMVATFMKKEPKEVWGPEDNQIEVNGRCWVKVI